MKLSVIVPVYNVAPYLRECLDSLLAQTCADWEAVCVDDGSTDGSGAILDEYAANDPRFRVIHQKNAGVSAARNAAIDVAKGEWIAFLDADDAVSPRLVVEYAMQISALVSTGEKCEMLFSACEFIDEPRNVLTGKAAWRKVCSLRFDIVDRSFCSACYGRDFLGDVRFRGFAVGEDRLFLAEVLARASSIYETDLPLVRIRRRRGSATRSGMRLATLLERAKFEFLRYNALNAASLSVDGKVWKRIGHSLVAQFVRDISLLPLSERDDAWRIWRSTISSLPDKLRKRFALSTKFALGVVRIFRSRFTARLVCEFPLRFWLFARTGRIAGTSSIS